MPGAPQTALVTGAAGQDGFFLTRRLLDEGSTVHAVVRRSASLAELAKSSAPASLVVHELDVCDAAGLTALIHEARPTEVYNLAGQSSVSRSFSDPVATWRTNTEVVLTLLEALRSNVPGARMYQSSSGEMFGWVADDLGAHNETSPFNPRSPYAAAKAAAHLLCTTYREAYGLRVACGILFNHESRRRPAWFLTRKVTDHVRALRSAGHVSAIEPLRMGNLAAQRDWGFAPDYVDGMVRIIRQLDVRASQLGKPREPDVALSYRDYVLATGKLHAVWQLVDRAFALGGWDLVWEMDDPDPRRWQARFRTGGGPAVVVDPSLLRPSDPTAIRADPARARGELGWDPVTDIDTILSDMLADG